MDIPAIDNRDNAPYLVVYTDNVVFNGHSVFKFLYAWISTVYSCGGCKRNQKRQNNKATKIQPESLNVRSKY